MFIKHQFFQKKLVLHLLESENVELLTHIENKQEYILLKTEKREVSIIRISLQQYDWKRDLFQSVNQWEQLVYQNLNLPPFQKKVNFHHLFFADYPPVDDWVDINDTEGRFVYFFTDERLQQEWEYFENNLGIQLGVSFTFPDNPLEAEYQTEQYKRRINQIHNEKVRELQSIFQYGKPFFSYILIACNIIMFLILEISGGSTNPGVLIQFGAKYNDAIMEGEWWRIISSMFLHIGMFHLLLNMMAIYFVGIPVERMYGSTRYLFIYFLAGIAGGVASFTFTPGIAAGASGAIFGLFGALLFFGIKRPKIFLKTIGPNVIFIVLLNIVFGFSIPQIDNSAHIGGLIGGFLAAACVSLPNNKAVMQQSMGGVLYLLFLTVLLMSAL